MNKLLEFLSGFAGSTFGWLLIISGAALIILLWDVSYFKLAAIPLGVVFIASGAKLIMDLISGKLN